MIAATFAYLKRHHVALLALLVAMSGTAYAAEKITGRDVANGSLSGKDLKNRTLQGRDLRPGSLKQRHLDATVLEETERSVTVLKQPDGGVVTANGRGFDDVEREGTGLYSLSGSDDPYGECNYATALLDAQLGPTATPAATVAINPGIGSGEILVVVRDAEGNRIDLGEASGLGGFSVLSRC